MHLNYEAAAPGRWNNGWLLNVSDTILVARTDTSAVWGAVMESRSKHLGRLYGKEINNIQISFGDIKLPI